MNIKMKSLLCGIVLIMGLTSIAGAHICYWPPGGYTCFSVNPVSTTYRNDPGTVCDKCNGECPNAISCSSTYNLSNSNKYSLSGGFAFEAWSLSAGWESEMGSGSSCTATDSCSAAYCCVHTEAGPRYKIETKNVYHCCDYDSGTGLCGDCEQTGTTTLETLIGGWCG